MDSARGADILVELHWSLGRVALGGASLRESVVRNRWAEGRCHNHQTSKPFANDSKHVMFVRSLDISTPQKKGKCIPKHVVVLCFGSRKEAPNNYCAYLSLQKLLNLESRTWVSPAATWNNITTDYSNAAGVPRGLLFKTTFWVGCPSFQLRVPKSVREIHHDLSFIATSLQGHSDWRFILYLAKKSSTPKGTAHHSGSTFD